MVLICGQRSRQLPSYWQLILAFSIAMIKARLRGGHRGALARERSIAPFVLHGGSRGFLTPLGLVSLLLVMARNNVEK